MANGALMTSTMLVMAVHTKSEYGLKILQFLLQVVSTPFQKMIFTIGKAAGVSNIKLTNPKKNETEAMIKQLYQSRGYVPSKKTMKKAKKAAEEKAAFEAKVAAKRQEGQLRQIA